MLIKITLNGKVISEDISPDLLLLDFCRNHSCYSVKRGCDTSNCGLCTVWLDGKPVLSCTVLAARANGRKVTTLEGLQKEAKEFGEFLADEGGEQCGFCNPGFIMNVLAMERELENPTEEDILEYLSGNLCRCSGFISHMRAIQKWIAHKRGVQA
jgi:carbon-monoxide dehydrogenase small subunit